MGRLLRFLPRPGALVEITQRTAQGRHLFRPSSALNRRFLGALAKAQQKNGVSIHAVACLSNHFHLLASFRSAQQMARFMSHLGTNLSKEIGRLHNQQGPLFQGRYRAIPVSDEEVVQVARLRYLLAQGCKENLVASPRHWTGVSSIPALTEGRPLRGLWIDRSRLARARHRRPPGSPPPRAADFTDILDVELTPLPCWQHLESTERRRRISEMVDEIEDETRQRHHRDHTRPLGMRRVRSTHPHRRTPLEPRPAPRFHASRARIAILEDAYRDFETAYRRAARDLRSGHRDASFPRGCFPPPLPFVPPPPENDACA